MKKISFFWSLLAGVLAVVLQIAVFYARFGRWNSDATPLDHALFFVAGALGGALLIFFLNRQVSVAHRWILLAAFLVASPIALLMMVGGGLLGWFGILLFPLITWGLFLLLGAGIGRLVRH